MITYAVLLGGEVTPCCRLLQQIRGARFIAADSGIRHAATLGVEVELWVGDFDSTDDSLSLLYAHVPRQIHSSEKDATDGELALREALRRGAQRIIMLGGLAGRTDHVLAHLSQMLTLSFRGISVHLTSGNEEAWPLLPGRTQLDMAPGTQVSILGLSNLKALSLSNLRWVLTRHNVPLGSTLTLSNEANGPIEINLEEGSGVIILTPIQPATLTLPEKL